MRTVSQDGGRLMGTTTGILVDEKQGQFVTKSQIPGPLPRPPPPPGYPLASSPFPLGLVFCCGQSPSPPNSEILVFLPGAGAQVLYQKAERMKPRGLQAQKEIRYDAVAEHREQRPGSGERRWLGSPCVFCGCAIQPMGS